MKSDHMPKIPEHAKMRAFHGGYPDEPLIRDAEREQGVPGEWTCDTCGYGLSTRSLNANTGVVGVRAVIAEERCPNDGALLRSLTWRECAEANMTGVRQLTDRLVKMQDALHELIRPDSGQCNQCHGKWLYRRDQSWVYSDGEHYPHCIGLGAQ